MRPRWPASICIARVDGVVLRGYRPRPRPQRQNAAGKSLAPALIGRHFAISVESQLNSGFSTRLKGSRP
ncbi:hypothetical protein Y032_0007g3457 [Ancylostoma ceylanicum]|uniref:Uncharacterized protein n=1 Tax=Ancylostoma ceylanicum TaxID=53326 RepID=A0A016VND4_9BILA|nr:hypothetical protein Y032_0007g3457 [Ancylostoma ceylanicum]